MVLDQGKGGSNCLLEKKANRRKTPDGKKEPERGGRHNLMMRVKKIAKKGGSTMSGEGRDLTPIGGQNRGGMWVTFDQRRRTERYPGKIVSTQQHEMTTTSGGDKSI